VLVQSGSLQQERTRAHADHFLVEMRSEIARCAAQGQSFVPRLRSVHERPGHATPEFRTLLISPPDRAGQLSPELLSVSIAHFAKQRAPDRLVLVLDAVRATDPGETISVLIGEARGLAGTRLFFFQPYELVNDEVRWGEPFDGSWRDPGEEELILDAAFTARVVTRTRRSPGSC
jgi:hypothetical protein